MKEILVIIDGGEPSDYNGCTNINYIKEHGKYGLINNTPEGLETNSLNCIMTMLGIDKEIIPKGRSYLEALAIDEEIGEDDLIFRCNNVEINDGRLISSCSNKDNFKNSFIKDNIKLINMGSYKNLLIVEGKAKEIDTIITYPPHENMGKKISEILPRCKDKELQGILEKLIYKYSLYPWSVSIKEEMPAFSKINNKNGAVVCKTEIVKGIGKALKMYCPNIENTTADVDTDLKAKAKKALELISEYDFVLLHVNGADESAHRKNRIEKLKFIKKIDEELIKYLIENCNEDTKIIVTSDHGTSCDNGKHINGLVSYYIFNNKER